MGSEMCIRDRHGGCIDTLQQTRPTQRAVNFYCGFYDDTADRIFICLLYTSDAADDLLCVDLGGRRIIKKKKNSISLYSNSLHMH